MRRILFSLLLSMILFGHNGGKIARADCGKQFATPHLADGRFDSTAFPSSSEHAKKTYAILISGAMAGANPPAFWNSISLVYSTLAMRGIPKEQIQVLNGAHGKEVPELYPGASCPSSDSNCHFPFTSDLECDGKDDISGYATVSGIKHAFQQTAARLENGDQVFIYYIGHGDNHANIFLDIIHGGQLFMPYETGRETDFLLTESGFKKLLNIFPKSTKIAVILDTCYGGFFTSLASKNRCILTATSDKVPAWMISGYGAFSYALSSSLLGENIDGSLVSPSPQRESNGEVSLAHLYASVRSLLWDFRQEPTERLLQRYLGADDSVLKQLKANAPDPNNSADFVRNFNFYRNFPSLMVHQKEDPPQIANQEVCSDFFL